MAEEGIMEEEAVNAKILLSASACNDKDRHKRRAVPANFLRLEITIGMCFKPKHAAVAMVNATTEVLNAAMYQVNQLLCNGGAGCLGGVCCKSSGTTTPSCIAAGNSTSRKKCCSGLSIATKFANCKSKCPDGKFAPDGDICNCSITGDLFWRN